MKVLPLCKHYCHPECMDEWLKRNKVRWKNRRVRGWDGNMPRHDDIAAPFAVAGVLLPSLILLFQRNMCRFAAFATRRCLRRATRQQRAAPPLAAAVHWANGGSSNCPLHLLTY